MEDNRLSERVLNILEWNEIIRELSQRCGTVIGKNVSLNLRPLELNAIKKRIRQISELKGLMTRGVNPDLSGIADIQPLINLAAKGGVLSIQELADINNFITASVRIIRFIINNKADMESISIELRLNRLPDLNTLLSSSITERMELNDNKYPEIRNINESIFSLKQEIEKKLHKIIHSQGMDTALQEKIFTTRNERYVILVKTNMKGRVKGNLQDISSSESTLYIEPDSIISQNNKLIMLGRQLQLVINKILRELSAETAIYRDELLENTEALAYFDFLCAASRFSVDIKGSEAEISGDPVMVLNNARHPLLYLMMPGNVVANDISIGKDFNCLIISGANTGGKTVLLKTMGLCALLTMFGLHIPAGPDSVAGVFKNILADIGDDQSISQSLSTYSGQIVNINEMLKKADRSTLILIDEIIVGTNPRQGAALARAILEALIETEARVVTSTHYSELKELASADQRFRNASVSFDIDTLKPTYKLRIGIPGTSYAIDIARNYGIPEKILSRSRELLDTTETTAEALLENIQKHREEMDKDHEAVERMKEELENEKSRYAGLLRKLDLREYDIKKERGIEFLDDLKSLWADITQKLQAINSEKELNKIRQDIIETQDSISRKLQKESTARFSGNHLPFDADKAKPGDLVIIASLEKQARLESIDRAKRTASVILGNSIKTRYSFDDLLSVSAGNKKSEKKKTKTVKTFIVRESSQPVTIQTSYNTIDLRGLTVDEAINKMESDFDRMIRTGITSAVVIHGHGTGALKSAVRSNMMNSFYVDSFRPGIDGEGGDGVSIATLKK